MRFLRRLLGRREERPVGQKEASEPVCPHVTLVPRWDSAGDIGKSEKVSSFICVGCQASFSREEGEQLQATEAERVRLRVRLGEAERLDKQ